MISPGVFFIFSDFWFSLLLGGRRGGCKRAKNGPKCEKKSVCCAPFLRNHTSYDYHIWNSCLKWSYLQEFFFHCSKILIFWVVRGIKGQKIAQNYKKVCGAWYLRNHTSYDHHLWYIRNCKMIISLGVFLFFQNFDFWVVRRVKGQKWSKMTKKTTSFGLYISGTIHHMILIYGTHI